MPSSTQEPQTKEHRPNFPYSSFHYLGIFSWRLRFQSRRDFRRDLQEERRLRICGGRELLRLWGRSNSWVKRQSVRGRESGVPRRSIWKLSLLQEGGSQHRQEENCISHLHTVTFVESLRVVLPVNLLPSVTKMIWPLTKVFKGHLMVSSPLQGFSVASHFCFCSRKSLLISLLIFASSFSSSVSCFFGARFFLGAGSAYAQRIFVR